MIALLLALPALADPAALRAPAGEAVAVVGVPEVVVGARFASGLGLAAGARLDGGAVELGVDRRVRLAGGDHGWHLDAHLGVGLAATLARPGLALALTPAVVGGVRGGRAAWTGGLVAPLAVGPGGLRAPLLLETWAGGRAGRAWLGVRLAAGVVGFRGEPPATAAEAGLVLAVGG